MLKEQKGITLVALVITIIVLIILATISISMVIGNEGLIGKARQGADNYSQAATAEQTQLNTIETYINGIH